MSDPEVKKIKKALAHKKQLVIQAKDMLSSGSTLVNLAVSGRSNGAFAKGHVVLFVGESEGGKSWLAMNTLAEAVINPNFKDHRLIYNDLEGGTLMDINHYFGKLGARIEIKQPPTIEDFYYGLDDHIKEGPVIEVLDSMDAIDTESDQKKFQKGKRTRAKGKEDTGNYGMAKAKANASGLRIANNAARASGSIVIIICQARDKIGFGFEKNTRSGGRALRFYAQEEIWFKPKGKIKRLVLGKPREVGGILTIQVKKNRQTGRHPSVDLDFYHASGIDDLGSMITWCIIEKHWKGTESTVKAPEFDFDGKKEDLIKKIENENMEGDLKSIVTEVWDKIREGCEVNRKSRYT